MRYATSSMRHHPGEDSWRFFLEESQQVSKNTYQPTKQWGPTVAAFRADLQSPQCAFLNVTLS